MYARLFILTPQGWTQKRTKALYGNTLGIFSLTDLPQQGEVLSGDDLSLFDILIEEVEVRLQVPPALVALSLLTGLRQIQDWCCISNAYFIFI